MKEVKLNIGEDLLNRIQKIADYYEQPLDDLFSEIMKKYADEYDDVMQEISKVPDEDIEFLFSDYAGYKHPNPNNMAKIIPIFQK